MELDKLNNNRPAPELTIGMPVFNDSAFLEESLQSILKQTFQNVVLIISDDGSIDGSELICRKYAENDSRIIYIRQPVNLGISKNMEFLLKQAKTPYFMWAADDDLWHPDFIKELITLLKKNDSAVTAFCSYKQIDEKGNNYAQGTICKNYGNDNKIRRLINFVCNSDDGFGYGIFKTNAINQVEFPIWWWPNKKTPFNNIYPTLCYYLAQGDFAFYDKEVLFFKREKTEKNSNHILTGKGSSIKETIAYIIRRFNLVTFSTKLIRKSSGPAVAIILYFPLLFHWFLKSSLQQLKLPLKSLINKLSL